MDFRTETEEKFLVNGWSYEQVCSYLTSVATPGYTARRHDIYWKAPNISYLRLNTYTGELTTKANVSPDSLTTRIEETVTISPEDIPTIRKVAILMHGQPVLSLNRRVSTFRAFTEPVPGTLFNVELAVYQIDGDDRVFFEIEGETMQVVDSFFKTIDALSYDLTPLSEDIVTIFTKGTK